MRLAFLHFGGAFWQAGNEFIENILLALRTLGPDCPTLVLVVDQDAPEQDFRALAAGADMLLQTPLRAPEQAPPIPWSLREHFAIWLRARLRPTSMRNTPQPLTEALHQHQVDVLFSMARPELATAAVPTVVWLPDFQHRRLPENFDAAERARRDHQFDMVTRQATRLLVTSEEVRLDLAAFEPAEAGKARRIPYVASIPAKIYGQDPYHALAAYHLPEKFIYLPNQFWRHKNHTLVLEALGQLKRRGVQPTLVCTGNSFDFRRTEYFGELMQMVSRLDIRDQFIYLGQVPRLDVFRLMRQSVCVLNPSLFEGLGLSVAESKSIGKRVLVSDLTPLREQEAPGALYFDPHSADDLAAKLELIWTTAAPGPDARLEAAAQAELPHRQTAFGRALMQVFAEAQADYKTPASTA